MPPLSAARRVRLRRVLCCRESYSVARTIMELACRAVSVRLGSAAGLLMGVVCASFQAANASMASPQANNESTTLGSPSSPKSTPDCALGIARSARNELITRTITHGCSAVSPPRLLAL